ncbi:MAG: hypothetical protein ACRCYX_09140 [Dermatophilaceae bacterium]
MPAETHRHQPWTCEARKRDGPWRLAQLRTGCACGWVGPTYDLHDTSAQLAYDEAVWAYQDHLETSPDHTAAAGSEDNPVAGGTPPRSG